MSGAHLPESYTIRPATVFEPFPPDALLAVTTPPNPPTYGNELLPLLRWLVFHVAPTQAVLVQDANAVAAPVLAVSLPAGCSLREIAPGTAVPHGAGLIHVTAEITDAQAAELAGALAPGGLLVIERAAPPGCLLLGVADGVALCASEPPPPVFVWLQTQPEAARASVCDVLDRLGRQFAKEAALELAAAGADAERKGHAKATKRAQLTVDAVWLALADVQKKLDRVTAERDAITQSSSWRATSPVRRALLAAKTRLRPDPAVEPKGESAKDRFRKAAAQDLWDFLVSAERLTMPSAEAPDVSILLVLYNQAPLTLLCLQSIAQTVPHGASAEIVIVDNASSDDTGLLLSRVDGAVVIRNSDNKHFLHGVNQALAVARGRDVLLLNNDAQLQPGTLQAARRTLHSAPDIGAVGGRIILPDGTLQEAGSIVWQDGTCVGYGRGRRPDEAEFQFRRPVDFCSGAFLLVRGDLMRSLGGLDPAFAPAYYEEVDLCMRLRQAGARILYDPEAAIMHFEFGSSASSDAAFELQRRNHTLFASRHATWLQQHHLPAGTPAIQARMDRGRRRILYIDDRVPYPELGAGYPRAARIIRELVADGWFVTLYPAHDPVDDWDDTYAAFPREVEFMLGHGYGQMQDFLRERDGLYDTILVSRPHNMRGFLAARNGTHAGARLIYDAEAMFTSREVLRMAQAGHPASAEQRRAMLQDELRLTENAATVTAVNEHEADIFRGGGHKDVRVLGLGVEPQPIAAGFSPRDGFLFVGLLDEDASPNADALGYFVNQIMPLLSAKLGRPAELTVAGRCRSPRVRALAGAACPPAGPGGRPDPALRRGTGFRGAAPLRRRPAAQGAGGGRPRPARRGEPALGRPARLAGRRGAVGRIRCRRVRHGLRQAAHGHGALVPSAPRRPRPAAGGAGGRGVRPDLAQHPAGMRLPARLRALFGAAQPGPRACPLRLVPVNDVAGEGEAMTSLGSDPYVLLGATGWRGLPRRPLRVRLRSRGAHHSAAAGPVPGHRRRLQRGRDHSAGRRRRRNAPHADQPARHPAAPAVRPGGDVRADADPRRAPGAARRPGPPPELRSGRLCELGRGLRHAAARRHRRDPRRDRRHAGPPDRPRSASTGPRQIRPPCPDNSTRTGSSRAGPAHRSCCCKRATGSPPTRCSACCTPPPTPKPC